MCISERVCGFDVPQLQQSALNFLYCLITLFTHPAHRPTLVVTVNQSLGNGHVSRIVVQSRNSVILHFSLVSENCFVLLWVELLRAFL